MKLVVTCEKLEYLKEFRECIELLSEMEGVEVIADLGLPRSVEDVDQSLHVFLIDHRNIAAQPWLDALMDANVKGASCLFLVNEKELLDESEYIAIINELSWALRSVVPGARVGLVSTGLARMALMMQKGRVPREELVRTRSIGAYMTARDPEGILDSKAIYDFSQFQQIPSRFRSLQGYLSQANDDTRSVCAVISTRPTGKTMVCTVLGLMLPLWRFEERTVAAETMSRDEVVANADAVIVVTDHDYEGDLHAAVPILRRSCAWLVLNKSDDYARHDRLGQEVFKDCLDLARTLGISRDHLVLASAYHEWIVYEFRNGKKTLEDVICDPEVVLLDEWQLPLDKAKNRDRLRTWLEGYRGLEHIISELEGWQRC